MSLSDELKYALKRLSSLNALLLNDDFPDLYGYSLKEDLKNKLKEEYNFLLKETPKLIQKESQELQN